MCVLGYIFFIAMDFSMCVVLFGLSLTFLVSIEVMGSHVLVELGCWMGSKLSEADLGKEKCMA